MVCVLSKYYTKYARMDKDFHRERRYGVMNVMPAGRSHPLLPKPVAEV